MSGNDPIEDWKRRQEQLRPKDLNNDLAKLVQNLNDLGKYLGAQPDAPQPVAGVAHHHDYHQDVVIADHGLSGDLALPAALAAVLVVQELNEALESVKGLIESPLGEQSIDAIKEISTSIGEVWDQFKADVGQVIEDVKQQMTELVSPERAQDRAPAGQQEKSTELGGEHVDKDTAEIRKLHDEQEKQRAELDKRVTEQKDQLTKQYEGPEQEKHLEALKEAAENAAEALARRQEAEMQRLLEQQMQRLQEQQMQSRDR